MTIRLVQAPQLAKTGVSGLTTKTKGVVDPDFCRCAWHPGKEKALGCQVPSSLGVAKRGLASSSALRCRDRASKRSGSAS